MNDESPEQRTEWDRILRILVERHGPWLRAKDLAQLFHSYDLSIRVVRSGWLRPVFESRNNVLYSLTEVLQCMERIEAGEMPPSRRACSNPGQTNDDENES